LVTQLFGGTQGRYDTDAILADGKVGIGYTMDLVTDANLAIISKKHSMPKMVPYGSQGLVVGNDVSRLNQY